MRGEDLVPELSAQPPPGSPPHARGRPAGEHPRNRAHGITPACAGKTSSGVLTGTSPWDHPRMRGEDRWLILARRVLSGSPPHARGRLTRITGNNPLTRITPACAGKTSPTPRGRAAGSDHPRMRGEDSDRPTSPGLHGGSPPHARGRLKGTGWRARARGITPACAGKTAWRPPPNRR